MPDKEKTASIRWINLGTLSICLLLIVAVHGIAWLLYRKYMHSWEERAAFGEMFTITHSLFDGAAFVCLIFTLLIQRNEVKAQREESLQTIKILAQTAEMNALAALLDSRNRAYDRSVIGRVPTEMLDEETVRIEEIESSISDTVNEMRAAYGKPLLVKD